MNVLIVATNRCRDPEPVAPLGACITAASAARAGHAVRFLDLMFETDPLASLEAELAVQEPDVVGLSVRNLDNTEFGRPEFFLPALRPLVDRLRSQTRAQVLLGGPAVNLMPEDLLRFTRLRWAAVGEGEDTLPAFLEALADDRPAATPGIAQLRAGRFLSAAPHHSPPKRGWPDSQLRRWLDLDRYRSHLAPVPVQTKRGCPFRCVYCTYPAVEGTRFRLRPPEEVVQQLASLAAQGVRSAEVVDSVFNAPLEHALSTWEAVAARGARVRLQTHTFNPGFVSRELLQVMESAGFSAVGITAESAADSVLEGLGKNYDAAAVHRAARLLRRRRFPRIWFFLLGGPGETMATVRETLRFARTGLGARDFAFFSVGIRIYPGTPIHDLAQAQDRLPPGSRDLLVPRFYFAPGLDPGAILRAVGEAVAAEPRFLGPQMAGWNLLPGLRRGAALLGVPPPLWPHAVPIRRTMRWLGIR